MKSIKSIIQFIFMLILVFSLAEPSFADLYVEVTPSTAHVGDIVTITVTASNDGLVNWSPVVIYAPIPDELEYLSHVVPDKQQQNYNYATGIWDVNRMRHDERGHLKTLIITTKVLPEAEGKSIHATARFETLVIEPTGTDVTSNQPPARTDALVVYSRDNNTGNGAGNGTGDGTGSGNGTVLGNSTGNDKISNIMGNLTNPGKENNPLINPQGRGGGGKSYEVFKTTNPTNTIPQDTLYGIMAILALLGIIAYGYFKEIIN